MTSIDDLWEQSWAAELADADASGIERSRWKVSGRKTKDKPTGEDLDHWFTSGREQIHAYKEWLESTGWGIVSIGGVPAIEFQLLFSIEDEPIRAFIDCVYDTGSELVIVDYKSGSRMPKTSHQLGLYSVGLELMTGLKVRHGAFYDTRKGTLGPIEDLSRWDHKFWSSIFKGLRKAREVSLYLPNIGDHCHWCGVRDYCFAHGGPQAHLYDPLAGAESK